MIKLQALAVAVLTLTIIASVAACMPQTTVAPMPEECSQLAIAEESIRILPGDDSGLLSSGTDIYLRNPVPPELPEAGAYIDARIVSHGSVLHSQTLPVFTQPSGVEIAILPDMDPGMIACPPDPYSQDSNKKYYLADVIAVVLQQLSLDDGGLDANSALVAKPGRGTERVSCCNAAYNLLVTSLPRIAAMDKDAVATATRRQLVDWAKKPGRLPRLILVLRLHETPADIDTYIQLDEEYDPISSAPTVVVDIGHYGNVLKEGGLTIIPLGYAPWRWEEPGWPPPSAWERPLHDEMPKLLASPLKKAVKEISQVFAVPELRWPIVLTKERAEDARLQVTMHLPHAEKVSCSRPLTFTEMSSSGVERYLALNGWIITLTSVLAALSASPLGRKFFRSLHKRQSQGSTP